MAIAVILDFPGATLDQYDRVLEHLGLKPQGSTAPGGLFHWVTPTESGIRVTDVWETPEQFEAYSQQHIGPAAAQVGLPNPPEVTILPVHNFLTAS